ncbi:metallo-beta-lactamase family protein [alpha proteobacterium BAL199]|jgi:glyoxylase-like metal-dependent hydrolase (beta-lactamase superfamily II)|nr:metallo-beta-lactamase family protein [alpha proteobacterium BAL199]
MAKAFASAADLDEKQITFDRMADGVYAFTAEGDPNTGVIVGDHGVMVIDARATPVLAKELIDYIATVTDKPVTHVFLTHYHAVRVLGASGYGTDTIMASRDTYDLIVERGQQDMDSEIGRFPRLFKAVETIPGLTWPTVVVDGVLEMKFGGRWLKIFQVGRGHTKGDTIVWLPDDGILFAGDLVEEGATPYCGDAYLTDWPATLDNLLALSPQQMMPGRGEAMKTPEDSKRAIDGTRAFVSDLMDSARAGVAAGKKLGEVYVDTHRLLHPKYGHWVIFEHCLPFNVSRAFDEASGLRDPRIWTAERDQEMWHSLQGALKELDGG